MSLARALAIAAGALEGAADKNGEPLILHVCRVVDRVGAMLHVDDEARPAAMVVAALHDVVEDGGEAWQALPRAKLTAAGFSDEVIVAVIALTRVDGEEYLGSYISRVCACPLARLVKHADLLDNLGREVVGEDPRSKARRSARYTLALRMVADAIIAEGQ